jgi:hypothetical protein
MSSWRPPALVGVFVVLPTAPGVTSARNERLQIAR